MSEAAAVGVKPSEFWKLTPREFAAVLEGQRRRDLQTFQNLVAAAWYGEAFHRHDKLPKLDKVMAGLGTKLKPPKPQSPEDMLAVIRKWNRELGGTENLPASIFKKKD